MNCKICGSQNIKVIYDGLIRDGALNHFTSENIKMYQCDDCNLIWHEPIIENSSYYESEEYRKSLEGTSEENDFYKLHDKESLDKFQYTGTTIFRHRIVCDIGCGCGAFLDYLKGVSQKVIGIEPSKKYRDIMKHKGFYTYAYASDAMSEFANKVDVITSFDVIEHVQCPEEFLSDVYSLLSDNGQAIIGTPTDAPVMRELLGEIYEKNLLFSTQHPWILSEYNMNLLAQRVGFKNVKFKYFQRYGIDNMLGWLNAKKAKSNLNANFVTDTLNGVWKGQLQDNKLADYIVMYLNK